MVGLDHLVVVVQDALLEDAEALRAVERNSQVHAGFVIFQFGAASHDAVHGHVQRSAKIKCDVGNGSKAVQIPQPVGGTSACGVPRKGGVNVAVCQNEVTPVQQR